MPRRTPTLALLALAAAAILAFVGLRGARGRTETGAAPEAASGSALAPSDAALAAPAESTASPDSVPSAQERTALAAGPAPAESFEVPLFLAGRVVDDTGAPVPGAEVAALIAWEDGSDVRLSAVCDDEGAFVYEGEWEGASSVSLHAQADGAYLDGELPGVAPRTSDAVVVLERGGFLEGRVLLGEVADPEGVRVLFDPNLQFGTLEASPGQLSWHGVVGRGLHGAEEVRLELDGSFRVGPVRVGVWTVRVAYEEQATPLAELAGVPVRADESTRDARLDPLDLRERLHEHVLRIVDEDGQPIGGGSLLVQPAGNRIGLPLERDFADGLARIVVPESSVDVLIRSPGYRNARVEGVAEDREVVMTAGFRVRLVLSGVEPPREPEQLQVTLVSDEGQIDAEWSVERMELEMALGFAKFLEQAARDNGQELSFVSRLENGELGAVRLAGGQRIDARGEAEFVLGEPGRYRVRWCLFTSAPDDAPGRGIRMWEARERVEVADAAGEQVFRVHLSADELVRQRAEASSDR